jgi:hypothetical protein
VGWQVEMVHSGVFYVGACHFRVKGGARHDKRSLQLSGSCGLKRFE